jgi:hypothetical protein
MHDAADRTALCHLGKVQTGGEILAPRFDHDRLHVFRNTGKECVDAQHGRVVECVAFFRSHDAQKRDLVVPLDLQ